MILTGKVRTFPLLQPKTKKTGASTLVGHEAPIGAFAEYAAVSVNAVAKVPEYLSDEEAACVPLTALTALQALDLMEPKAGETIFISGGTAHD